MVTHSNPQEHASLMNPLAKPSSTYRDCSFVARSVHIGGVDKSELLARLDEGGIELNAAGRALFAHSGFTTATIASIVETREMTVGDLGFDRGATIDKVVERAGQLRLAPCPIELGPHLRLQYIDQPEGYIGHAPSQHKAPPGSLTIVSRQIAGDDHVPKGFYLRRVNGALCLRGYHCGPDHVWSADDHLVFIAGRTWTRLRGA